MSQFVYDLVTSHIVLALSRGVVPWRKPWKGTASTPINAVSKRPYQGVNLLLLGVTPYEDHRWVTFRQAQELGGKVRRGEKSSIAVFYKHRAPDGPEDESQEARRRSYPLLRFYHLFNVEQVEGLRIAPLEVPTTNAPPRIAEAESLVSSMPDPPRICTSRQGAWYRPEDDVIGVPPIGAFISADSYYATFFHELGHSTGHASRLNRAGVTNVIQFGSETYSREELIAELTSAFLCAGLGLDNSLVENSASYINGWMGALKHDNRAILVASSHAQKAANFIRCTSISHSGDEP